MVRFTCIGISILVGWPLLVEALGWSDPLSQISVACLEDLIFQINFNGSRVASLFLTTEEESG